MQFSGKFGVFTPPLEGSRPPLGKILDPPLVIILDPFCTQNAARCNVLLRRWLLHYRPQRSAKVMFLQVCVCPRGGLPQCMLGYHSPIPGTPPGAGAPPQEQAPPRNRPPSRPGTPQQTATAADGMHSTGMHSCLLYYYCNIFLTGGINYLFDTCLILILLVDGDRHGDGYVSLLSMQIRS